MAENTNEKKSMKNIEDELEKVSGGVKPAMCICFGCGKSWNGYVGDFSYPKCPYCYSLDVRYSDYLGDVKDFKLTKFNNDK